MDKAVKGDGGVVTYVTIINKVFELHRRNVHYSIKKTRPQVYESFVKKLENIPLAILQDSYDIYKGVKQEKGTLPHPNYFLRVALNKFELHEEEELQKPKQIWGKTI